MKWIKTSKKLPKDGQAIIFIARIKDWLEDHRVGHYHKHLKHCFVSRSGWQYTEEEVPLWMPFPEIPDEI